MTCDAEVEGKRLLRLRIRRAGAAHFTAFAAGSAEVFGSEPNSSASFLRFRSAAFHPESSLSFSNPRVPSNGQECAIVAKPNRSYRNGRRRRHTAIIYGPAPRGTRPKSHGPCEAGALLANCFLAWGRSFRSFGDQNKSRLAGAEPGFELCALRFCRAQKFGLRADAMRGLRLGRIV
jgi:hypothetical protein